MKKLVLHTGLFEDGDIIIKAANAPVIDLREPLDDAQWDEVIDQIMETDLVVTA
ncbi:hypothetical protein MTBPR1_90011 [Candidatus Terasakiella magnetica]|uniref:Uncharacterized protein n=1 Tax=Candidatus Terasakiella magnetica TaxID=1867952 RepID=A0A1C3RLL0_9PROT|nr:hypothetical protein [Candidatus Terasakiella magnetica]SCA58164.1 hypothetical protein MTBPR1_90011 [Candidatus Terasakiella magnetica]